MDVPSTITHMSKTSYAEFTTRFGLDNKPHQAECVEWCMRCERANHGGLIADEMGLGKTIQIIALLHLNDTPTTRTLIVVPVALLHQWREALDRMPFDGAAMNTVILYHGAQRNKTTPEQLEQAKVVITTYGEISRKTNEPVTNKPVPTSPIHQIQWTRIVFDEAHHLRNRHTVVHKLALELTSSIKWLLTGTPIQNSKDDFYALCRVINIPPRLYMGTNTSDNLKELVSNYLMKRTKKQLEIPMPELKEHVVTVEWANDHERELAEQIHRRAVTSGTDNCNYKIRLPQFRNKLVDHLRARQMCVLPSLLQTELENIRNGGHEDQQEERQEVTEEELTYFEKGIEEGSCSSKLNSVVKHIVERRKATTTTVTTATTVPSEKKMLVFCEFRKEMDYLHKALTANRIYTERIDGSTPDKLKKSILGSQHIQVLLLQVKTCSEGLNLQQYTDVYIVTPQWNPSVEAQAICRSYRIGQTEEVNVFRFIMSDTKEDIQSSEMKVMKRQEKKKEEASMLE